MANCLDIGIKGFRMYDMSHATCLHKPKRLVPSSGRRKDGSVIMICADCKHVAQRKSNRKRLGYDDWFQRQAGMCAFCGLPLNYDSNRMHLDHNHKTGKKRGLVHAQCNLAIGGAERALDMVGLAHLLNYLA